MNWKYMMNDLKKTLTPQGMLQFIKSHKYTLAISGTCALVGLAVFIGTDIAAYRSAFFKLVTDYELRTLDARFRFRGPRPVDKNIALVVIDQQTVNQYHWPFPRFRHAQLLDRLCGAGARSIGMDIFFPYKDPTTPANMLKDLQKQMEEFGHKADDGAFTKLEEFANQADSDAKFAESLKKCGNVTLAHEFY